MKLVTKYSIDPAHCINCGTCRRHCPVANCIDFFARFQHTIAEETCIGCHKCYAVCPVPDAIVPLAEDFFMPPQVKERIQQLSFGKNGDQIHFE